MDTFFINEVFIPFGFLGLSFMLSFVMLAIKCCFYEDAPDDLPMRFYLFLILCTCFFLYLFLSLWFFYTLVFKISVSLM